MSVTDENGSFRESIWTGPERRANRPKRCPHCDEPLAHPEDLKQNEDIRASGLFTAYRRHRRTHFNWGSGIESGRDVTEDPYLGRYYDTNRDACNDSPEGNSSDPDEIVGHVYTVEVYYEARKVATVVAPNESRAKEKVKYDELPDGKDIHGNVPESVLTHEVHSEATKESDVTRSEEEKAERMGGWPW